MKLGVQIAIIMQLIFITCNVCNAQTQKLDSVKIELVDFSIETAIDISCEVFGSTFKNEKKIRLFKNDQYLATLVLLSNEFKQAKRQSFDVRGTIVYSYGKTNVKYCFDQFGYFYKDGKMYYNKNLLIYISGKLFTNHPKSLHNLHQQ